MILHCEVDNDHTSVSANVSLLESSGLVSASVPHVMGIGGCEIILTGTVVEIVDKSFWRSISCDIGHLVYK